MLFNDFEVCYNDFEMWFNDLDMFVNDFSSVLNDPANNWAKRKYIPVQSGSQSGLQGPRNIFSRLYSSQCMPVGGRRAHGVFAPCAQTKHKQMQ